MSTIVTFTKACRMYKSIIDEVIEVDVFQLSRSTCDSRCFLEYHASFIGYVAYDLRVSYIR